MKDLKHLPLIALLSLGVAACGADDDVDMDGEDAVIVENEAFDAEPDGDELLTDREPMANDPMMGDDTMMGGMNDPMMMGDGAMVVIGGVQPNGGTVYVALQDETIFGTAAATYGATVEPTDSTVEVMVPNVTPGDYAVAVFQDTNNDGQLNLGADGIPEEPWALSNDAGTMGAPAFDDASMTFDGMDDEVEVELSTL
jgi:uncharacterized protein (DUF2141 family)